MSSRVDPLVIGLVAAGLALVLVAIVARSLRPLGRMRLRRRQGRNLKRLRREAVYESVDRTRAPSKRSLATPTLGAAIERQREGLQQASDGDAAHIPEQAQRTAAASTAEPRRRS